MTLFILLGNLFSLCSQLLFFLSTRKKNKCSVIFLQVIDCSFCILSGFCFHSLSAVFVNVGNLLRAIILYVSVKNKSGEKKLAIKSKIEIITLTVVVNILALIFNTREIVGLLPIVASIQYTIVLLNVSNKPLQYFKFGIALNCAIWLIYDFCICDIAGGCILMCSGFSALQAGIRARNIDRRKDKAE